MKTYRKSVIALSMVVLLSGGVAAASTANNSGTQVTGPVTLQNLPTEARNGSIQVKDENEGTMAALARISAVDAARIANTAHSGKVVETQLENENGSLIWEVTQQDINGKEIQLKLDAGNGYLLAADSEEHEDGKDEDHEDSDEGHHGEHEDHERNE